MTNVTGPKPQIKEEESKTVEQPTEKCGWDQVAPFVNLKNRRKNKARWSHKSYHLKQSSNPQDQNTKFEHDQSKSVMGRRNGRVKF